MLSAGSFVRAPFCTFFCPRCSPGSLSGRVAIVTGSTSGIGLGIARSLLGAGAHVMLNGFGDAAAVEATRDALTKEFAHHGAKVAYSPADMASAEQIHQMVNDTVEKLGGIDILINKSEESTDSATQPNVMILLH
jgi:3-hydroxybutyrate dehydrogenase